MVALSTGITRAMSEQLTRVNGNKTNGITPPAKPAPLDSGRCEMRLALIRNNGGTQSRAAIDWEYVGELMEALEGHVLLPAIDVYFDGQDYWLADGFHRYEAHKKLDYPNIFANIHQGTRWNAVLHSVGSNATHGKRRTNEDKNRAVRLLLTDPDAKEMSNRQIAEHCKVSHQFVNDVKAVLDVAQKFGKEYPREVAKVAITHKIRTRAMADEVERLYENGRETFDEVKKTGWVQPGDEADAAPVSGSVTRFKKAVAKKQEHHRYVGAQASGKPYTPPAESEPTDASPFTASVEWRDGSYHAVIVMSGYKTEYAAMKAIKEVQSMLIKELTQ